MAVRRLHRFHPHGMEILELEVPCDAPGERQVRARNARYPRRTLPSRRSCTTTHSTLSIAVAKQIPARPE